MRRITGSLLPALAAAILILGACTPGGRDRRPHRRRLPSTAASAAAPSGATGDVCADADAVKTSLDSLASTDVKAVGKDGLSAAVDAVKAAVETLIASAGPAVSTQATALKTALDNLGTSISGLASDAAVADKAADIQTAVAGVKTAADDLRAALPGCS